MMMEGNYHTRLGGSIVVTSHYHEDAVLQADSTLYKFLLVLSGHVSIEVDHVRMVLQASETMPLTPLHHLRVLDVCGEYVALLFNSNFYCIYGHDKEVSCNGFIFHGSSNIMKIRLSDEEAVALRDNIGELAVEMRDNGYLQEEMLRIVLKRFIIMCTRIARNNYSVCVDNDGAFDTVRKFHVLVDNHFKEKKRVQEYAEMLFRSPKTLSNLFSANGLHSPLRIIHERIAAEAKRLLLYTDKSAKEIGDILGFEDIASFSRFFKRTEGISIMEFRKK